MQACDYVCFKRHRIANHSSTFRENPYLWRHSTFRVKESTMACMLCWHIQDEVLACRTKYTYFMVALWTNQIIMDHKNSVVFVQSQSGAMNENTWKQIPGEHYCRLTLMPPIYSRNVHCLHAHKPTCFFGLKCTTPSQTRILWGLIE